MIIVFLSHNYIDSVVFSTKSFSACNFLLSFMHFYSIMESSNINPNFYQSMLSFLEQAYMIIVVKTSLPFSADDGT